MQGIVLEGTGKNAQLNGYSSAGKTGTAQKIDVATHTYSHTKLVASFAGFAPVSNPAIAVTVVIDTPTVGSRYGAEVSAPVFAEVAQEVLEYLGVPHDQPLKAKKTTMIAAKDEVDDAPSDNTADLTAMFDDVNNLPADDPLRAEANQATNAGSGAQTAGAAPAPVAGSPKKAPGILNALPAKMVAAFRANEGGSSSAGDAGPPPAPKAAPVAEDNRKGAVVVNASARVPVPSFNGAGLRSVVERADAVGLRVQAVGDGLAREQVPVAGTMVPVGTEVIVKFTR